MSSPFTIFRRHERILMVVITGLSMISFVLLGAVQDPRNIPTPLIVIFIAAVGGGLAMLAGMTQSKGTEWGLSGVILGAAIGVAAMVYIREASAVTMDTGNLTSSQLSELRRQRFVANQFIQAAFQQTFGIGLEMLPPPIQREYVFGFTSGGDDNVQDVVLGELLRREADQMGVVVSNDVVTEFIKRATSKKGLMETFQNVASQIDPQNRAFLGFFLTQVKEKPFTAQTFTKIRSQLHVSEAELLDAIRAELKTNQAFRLMFGRNYLPPEEFWTFYQQMNVRESAAVVSIPLEAFVDESAKPSEAELQEIFGRYRANFPGFAPPPSNRPEPGRPGFVQPRRVRLGYLEAVYDKIEPLVTDVTPEEIQKRYEERYSRSVPESDNGAESGKQGTEKKMDSPKDGPLLPPAKNDKQSSQTPPASTVPPVTDMPVKEQPAPTSKKESKPDQPAAPSKQPAPEKKETPPASKPDSEKGAPPALPAPKNPDSSALPLSRSLQQVAFLQEESAKPDAPAAGKSESTTDEKSTGDQPAAKPTPDKPASETKPADKKSDTGTKPSADKPASDQPANEAKPVEKKPAADMPAESKPAAKSNPDIVPPAPSTEPPPAPKSEIPPLDDTLKQELREEILRQKVAEEIQKRIAAAAEFLGGMAYYIQLEPTEESHLTLEQATKKIEKYAEENHLVYVVTPLLSQEQLAESEDYPVGRALTAAGQRQTVVDAVFSSAPTDVYRVFRADDFRTQGGFAAWKLEDKAAYAPESLDDEPVIREQVIAAWKRLKAEPLAKARAEELAKMVRESDKPITQVLGDTTITGKPDSLFLTVRETGEFTWMQKPIVPPTSLGQAGPVQRSMIPAVPDAGDEFFQEVFDTLKVGEVGIVPNEDHTAFYVVKIQNRYPSNEEELNKMREEFLAAGMQPNYVSLSQQALARNSSNWFDHLFEKHNVVIHAQQQSLE
jgi:hypothetical protein